MDAQRGLWRALRPARTEFRPRLANCRESTAPCRPATLPRHATQVLGWQPVSCRKSPAAQTPRLYVWKVYTTTTARARRTWDRRRPLRGMCCGERLPDTTRLVMGVVRRAASPHRNGRRRSTDNRLSVEREPCRRRMRHDGSHHPVAHAALIVALARCCDRPRRAATRGNSRRAAALPRRPDPTQRPSATAGSARRRRPASGRRDRRTPA